MRDVEEHARQILLRAKEQAEQLIAAAQVEGEKLKERAAIEGSVKGRAEGIAKGTEEGKKLGAQQALSEQKAQLTQLFKTLTMTATELNASRKRLEAEAVGEVIKLAVAIARRVTKKLGGSDPAVLTENISAAMKIAVKNASIRLVVHPSQRATLNSALPQLKLQWPALEHVELIDDAALAPGGCRVFTAQGEVHADLDGQIDRIAEELLPTTGGAL